MITRPGTRPPPAAPAYRHATPDNGRVPAHPSSQEAATDLDGAGGGGRPGGAHPHPRPAGQAPRAAAPQEGPGRRPSVAAHSLSTCRQCWEATVKQILSHSLRTYENISFSCHWLVSQEKPKKKKKRAKNSYSCPDLEAAQVPIRDEEMRGDTAHSHNGCCAAPPEGAPPPQPHRRARRAVHAVEQARPRATSTV